ncbi:ABC transporter ATP-binding protein [Patulibacter sp. SYSU D01012]|uniref:ABC transporter ATP-binding protein n=1 Tax=Patulibacter sp. SYSU D01012 TaxID=2817381 RepID=UPI001B307919|nr:ABC transporter ATP-binding protein [Patulibacter sp. SYSU D01012]
MAPLLEIEGLTLLPPGRHARPVVDDASLRVEEGETVGLVGESGAGKSLLLRTVLGVVPAGWRAVGAVRVDGRDVLTLDRAALARHRRERVALVPQDPRAAIDPLATVGGFLTEVARTTGTDRDGARARAAALLDEVGLPDPEGSLGRRPHAFSGGMLQRVVLAAALLGDPRLLLADEPTTALDVTTQAEVLRTLEQVRVRRGLGTVLVTHDLDLAAATCDRLVVLRAGRVVEAGPARRVFAAPQAAYTRELVAATPRVTDPVPDAPPTGEGAGTVLRVRGLRRRFGARAALDGVDLDLRAGHTLAVVGESGSGKSTLARIVVGLERADGGVVTLAGVDSAARGRAARRARAAAVQTVFQDPLLSFDPRVRAGEAVARALPPGGPGGRAARARRADALLERVGLDPALGRRLPRELSGGQRQRVAIARALAPEPRLLVLDEPTSALDVRVQARVLELLARLRADLGVAVLLISHDLAVVRRVANDVAVVRGGRIVEAAPTAELFARPRHPYTRRLLDAVPRPAAAVTSPV